MHVSLKSFAFSFYSLLHTLLQFPYLISYVQVQTITPAQFSLTEDSGMSHFGNFFFLILTLFKETKIQFRFHLYTLSSTISILVMDTGLIVLFVTD